MLRILYIASVMELKIYDDYHTLSLDAARQIIAQVQAKADSVLCLAAGDTPRLTYNLLAKLAADLDGL